ncbi:fluoride efflux transporter CrcB [Acaryochloris marina NIES-2412]|uniref:fluoride efflux transporter CrcB n=1 Tax=Acaryochloris marina TaxID=155978 RepID=UPI00405A41D8
MISPLFLLLPDAEILGVLTEHHFDLSTPIAISLGAIPGALSRYYLTIWLARWLGTGFPFGTLMINVSGALLMGFFATLAMNQMIASAVIQSLVLTGFLGSYTTFSTYALDTSILLQSGSQAKALIYWIGSIVTGGISLELGIVLARAIG